MYDELVKALRATHERVRQHPEVAIYVPPYQLSAAADFIEALPGWISVKEHLPDIGSAVIVSGRMRYKWETDFSRFVDVATYAEGELFETFNDWYEGQDDFEITHWMPLPTPPKEDA